MTSEFGITMWIVSYPTNQKHPKEVTTRGMLLIITWEGFMEIFVLFGF